VERGPGCLACRWQVTVNAVSAIGIATFSELGKEVVKMDPRWVKHDYPHKFFLLKAAPLAALSFRQFSWNHPAL